MTVKVTMANNGSDSVDFINASSVTLAQVKSTDGGSSNGSLALHTASAGTSTERVRIDSSGNVGIGTSTPNAAAGYTNVTVNNTSGGIYDINVGGTLTSRWYANSTAAFIGSNASIPLVFNTVGSERARIDSSGNLLVGGTAQTNGAKVESFFNGGTQNGFVSNDTASASGTTFFQCSNNGTSIGTIARVGTTSAVVYNTTSDQRLKSNIEDAAPVLDKLIQVQVRQYDWTEGDLHQDYGFVAQELEPLLSGIVTKGKTEEDIWQLDYSRLTPHLVKAIQEQQTIIADLKSRIETLEAK
jgi:Chaperone of endosialidase